MGGGGGRGMGGGGGRGMGGVLSLPPPADPLAMVPPPSVPAAPAQEIEMLRVQAQALEGQLQAINSRIEEFARRRSGSGLLAVVDAGKCTACGICQDICPEGAISVGQIAQVDREKCSGCGRCVAACPEGALALCKA
jgi:ferredoxin